MYLEHGLLTKNIKGFIESELDFIDIQDILTYILVPYKDRSKGLNNSPFWGVRRHVISDDKGKNVYIATISPITKLS